MDIPRTKLVCTIGPASIDRVPELVALGMSVARINFSHGTPDEHRAAVHAVRAAAHHARRSVAVMVDLPGAKVRLGDLPGGTIELEAGEPFVLRPLAGERRVPSAAEPAARADEPAETAASDEPAAVEPATAFDEPATTPDEPATDEPATVEPATATVEPATASDEPATVEPATVEPATVEPATDEPPPVADESARVDALAASKQPTVYGPIDDVAGHAAVEPEATDAEREAEAEPSVEGAVAEGEPGDEMPAEAEPAEAEPAVFEPAVFEPEREPEPVPAETEVGVAGAEPAETEHAEAEPAGTGPAEAEPAEPEAAAASEAEHVGTGAAETWAAVSEAEREPEAATAEPAAAEPETLGVRAARDTGAREATVSRSTLAQELEVGDRILLADGAAELRVVAIEGGLIRTEVVLGGTVRSRSGVNVPVERLSGPALTPADEAAIPRALELRVDMIAQSFVRSAADVRALRDRLPSDGPLVVAKIETRAGVDAFDDIVAASDGVMIARGDLGVEIPYEDVPLVQKDLLRRAVSAGCFTIVATQMLESMTAAQRPTRAEASDVANAVLDGADAVTLSAETAIGRFPVEAARAMVAICAATEEKAPPGPVRAASANPDDGPSAIVHGAAALAADYSAVIAAWCFTRTGRTAELLSSLRPRVPVLAFTINAVVARRLAPRWGVLPMVIPAGRTGEPLIDRMENAARSRQVLGAPGHVMLLTTSSQHDGLNRLELHEVQ